MRSIVGTRLWLTRVRCNAGSGPGHTEVMEIPKAVGFLQRRYGQKSRHYLANWMTSPW